MIGHRTAEVVAELLINIAQRRRHGHVGLHRKAQAVGLARAVIGVLADDADLGVLIGRVVKGVKNIVHIGVNGVGAVFAQQKPVQPAVVILLEFCLQRRFPVVFEMNGHGHLPPKKSKAHSDCLDCLV